MGFVGRGGIRSPPCRIAAQLEVRYTSFFCFVYFFEEFINHAKDSISNTTPTKYPEYYAKLEEEEAGHILFHKRKPVKIMENYNDNGELPSQSFFTEPNEDLFDFKPRQPNAFLRRAHSLKEPRENDNYLTENLEVLFFCVSETFYIAKVAYF